MKKNHTRLILFILAALALISFKMPGKNDIGNSYNVIYIDNSGPLNGSASMSNEMLDLIVKKVDSVKADKSAKLQLFLSNNFNPEHAKTSDGAKKIINKLNTGYTPLPNSASDIEFLKNYVFSDDLSNVQSVNISLFVTEYYLGNDLLGKNSGLLISLFAKEFQYLANIEPDKINVTVYYPKESKPVVTDACTAFKKNMQIEKGGFKNKVHIYFSAL
jgi:hypothetical protein